MNSETQAGIASAGIQVPGKNPKAARRAAIGSYLGATLEFYDFVLYATAAALVFPTVFFSGVDSGTATALSYITLAIGYIARPLGAILFGHYGDRLGRTRMLVLTISIMGVASVGIGLVPSSAQIGAAAPILLVTLRLLQGIAVGGEWAGASLVAMEHAEPRKRGFAGSIVASGGPTGAVLSTLAFSFVSLLPADQLTSWGWRIPFLASSLLVAAALVIRAKVEETPDFLAAKDRHETQRLPIISTFTQNWRSVLLLVLCTLSPFFLQSLTSTFGLSYAVAHGNAQPVVLWMLTISNFLTIGGVLLFAVLSDRHGRRKVMIIGYAVAAVAVWGAIALLAVPSTVAVLGAFIILQPIANASILGPLGAYMAEMFPVRNRFTGVGISYQLGATIASGFAPLVAASLLGAANGGTYLLTGLISLLCIIGITAVLLSTRIRVPNTPEPAS